MQKKGGERRERGSCCDFCWRTFLKLGQWQLRYFCEEPPKSLVLEMSPAAQRQTNTALISSLNANHQPRVFVMSGN